MNSFDKLFLSNLKVLVIMICTSMIKHLMLNDNDSNTSKNIYNNDGIMMMMIMSMRIIMVLILITMIIISKVIWIQC